MNCENSGNGKSKKVNRNCIDASITNRLKEMEDRLSELETSSFFGKSVMSNDVLLGHTGERMFCYSKHVKGHMMFIRNINMTPQTVGAQLWFALLCLPSLHHLAELHL